MADNEKQIEVQVCFASAKEYWLKTILLPKQSTVLMAIEKSGVMKQFPEIDLNINKIGIFSELVTLQHEVLPGDRIEIYRPLQNDPKELRKQRAKEQKQKKNKSYS